MPTTLICAVPGAEAGHLLEALSKESTDLSPLLLAVKGRHRIDLESANLPGALLNELRSELATRDGDPTVASDPWSGSHLGALSSVFAVPSRVVLVLAEPTLAAKRLVTSTGCSPAHALAVYERSLRRALSGAVGLEVAVVADTEPAANLVALLTGSASASNVGADADQDARDPGQSLPTEISELWHIADGLRGHHDAFELPDLPPESAWTTALLGLETDLATTTAALLFTADQLATVLESEPEVVQVSESVAEDDQFREPDEGGPYRLNASEDRRAYHRWLTWKREPAVIGGLGDPPIRKAATRASRRKTPLITVIVPVYRPPLWALERAVGSVLAQRFADWELRLCDDASGDPELTAYLRSLPRLDRRITVVESEHNGGIAAARNRAMAGARGVFVAFLDHDDELAPGALGAMAAAATPEDVDLVYSDEDKIDNAGERFDPLFKPDWSPDLLLSFAYTCHLTTIRRSLVEELGGFRSEYDGSDDWDLTLRATERARRIVHVPEVLYHWRNLPGSAASDSGGQLAKPWAYEAGRRAVADTLDDAGNRAK